MKRIVVIVAAIGILAGTFLAGRQVGREEVRSATHFWVWDSPSSENLGDFLTEWAAQRRPGQLVFEVQGQRLIINVVDEDGWPLAWLVLHCGEK